VSENDLSMAATRDDAALSRRLNERICRNVNRRILMHRFAWNLDYELCFQCNRCWPVILMRRLYVPDYETVFIEQGELESKTPIIRHYGYHWVCPVCERRPPDGPSRG